MLSFAHGAVINLFVLLGFVTVCSVLRGWSMKQRRPVPDWQTGLLFGVMAVVTMLMPVVAQPGIIFDARVGVLGAAGLLCGPITALVAMPLPILYRIYLGGSGTLPGIMEVILPAILGSLCHGFFRRRHEALTLPRILVSSLFVGAFTNLLIITFVELCLPISALAMGVGNVALIVLSTVVATAVISTLLVLERRHTEAVASLAESQRRMLHSQKMAAVGQLSRKIAHNFVNSLTAVMGNAQMAKDHAANLPAVSECMDEIIATVGRSAHLTAELLAFSSPTPLKVRRMALERCITGIEEMLKKSLDPDVEIEISASAEVGMVDVDPDRIEQVIMHLALNGADAMSGPGRLTLDVSVADLSHSEKDQLQAGAHPQDRHDGNFALLAVTDTGCGMAPDVVSHIFEPFFTTKKNRKNAGLGLATVYNIVQQHSGHIDVKSRPGKGTTVLVYLPLVGESPPASA